MLTHSQGFTIPENTDLYKHILRHFIRNQHFFTKKQDGSSVLHKEAEGNRKKKQDDNEIIDYIPLPIKQFVLDSLKEQMVLLSQIPQLYEHKMGDIVKTPEKVTRGNYKLNNIEMKLEKENKFLEEALQKINENGIETINLNEMVKFKKIVKRRLNVFNLLEDYIKATGALEKEVHNEKEVMAQEELQETVQKIQEIRENLGIDDIPKAILFSGLPETNKLTPNDSMSSGLTLRIEKSLSNPQPATNEMVKSILHSVSILKNVKRAISTLSEKKNISPENNTPLINMDALESSGQPSPFALKSSFDATVKLPRINSSEIIGEEEFEETPYSLHLPKPKFALYKGDPNAYLEEKLKSYHDTLEYEQSLKKYSEDLSSLQSPVTTDGLEKDPDNFIKFKMVKKKKKNPNTSTSSGSIITSHQNDRKEFSSFRYASDEEKKGKSDEEEKETEDEIVLNKTNRLSQIRKLQQGRSEPGSPGKLITGKSPKVSDGISSSKSSKGYETFSSARMADVDPFKVQQVKPAQIGLSKTMQAALQHLGTATIPEFLSQATGGTNSGVNKRVVTPSNGKLL